MAVLCEDDQVLAAALSVALTAHHLEVIARVDRGSDLLAAVAEHDPAVVVVDAALLGAQGVGLLAGVREASGARLVVLCPPGLDLPGLIEEADAVVPGDDLRPLCRLLAALSPGPCNGSGGDTGGNGQGQLERRPGVDEVPAVRSGYTAGNG
jgi:hypothetical protein